MPTAREQQLFARLDALKARRGALAAVAKSAHISQSQLRNFRARQAAAHLDKTLALIEEAVTAVELGYQPASEPIRGPQEKHGSKKAAGAMSSPVIPHPDTRQDPREEAAVVSSSSKTRFQVAAAALAEYCSNEELDRATDFIHDFIHTVRTERRAREAATRVEDD